MSKKMTLEKQSQHMHGFLNKISDHYKRKWKVEWITNIKQAECVSFDNKILLL